MFFPLLLNHHFISLEEFMHLLKGDIEIAPEVAHDRLVLVYRPDKERFETFVWSNKKRNSVSLAQMWVTRAPT